MAILRPLASDPSADAVVKAGADETALTKYFSALPTKLSADKIKSFAQFLVRGQPHQGKGGIADGDSVACGLE